MALATIRVKYDSSLGNPIPGVAIELRSTGGAFVDSGIADVNGEKIFLLGNGTYRVYLSSIGAAIEYTRPETIVVVGDAAFELYGTALVPPIPSNPALVLVYDYLYDLGLRPVAGIEVVCSIKRPSVVFMVTGPTLVQHQMLRTTAQGFYGFSLPDQASLLTEDVEYRIEIPSQKWLKDFTAESLNGLATVTLAAL